MPPTDAAPPACIVVTGVQGSGKTTMANAILASFLPDTARGTPSESTASDGKDTVDVTYLLEDAALGADAAMTSTERISAQESADLAAHPDGIATANRVATRGGVLPTGVTTRVTTRVVPAPEHASFAARVSVTYANEAEIHALIQRARLAHGESRGPPLRAAAGFNSEAADSDSDSHSDTSAESSSHADADAEVRRNPSGLTARDLGRVAAVLGVRTRDVPAAIRDRSKPYLPSRFVELLGKTRVVEFRSLRKGKAKRGRPRKDAKTKEHTKTPTLTGAVVDAVRAYLCRVAHGDWSRWGCIAGDVLVELRMRTNEGGEMSGNERDFNVCVVDSPGAPLTKSTWTNHHSRAHLVRALASTPLDALLCVCDGGFGPSRELRGALRESGCLDRMVSSPDGGAMALAWPLDKLVGTDPSISLDPDVYVAMQTKLAERGQGSELDGSEEDDDDSEDSGIDSPGFDEGVMGARSIERRLSGGASTPDESWTRCLARAAGRNGGIVKGAMASQPVHTFFGAVRDAGPKTKFRDSFPELVRYLTERTRDGTALRRRRGGGECEGDGEERSMKSAVIAVASRNVQKKRKGDDAWGAIEEVRRLDKEVEEEETEKPPPRLAVKPKSLLGSVENVKPFVESKVPLTVGLHPREPLRDVSAERRRADNAEDAAKKKGRSRVGAKVDPSMRMGPLEAAARGVGGAGGKGRGGRGLGVSARKVQFTPSCDVGAGVGSGAKKSQLVKRDDDSFQSGKKVSANANANASGVPWWERKL